MAKLFCIPGDCPFSEVTFELELHESPGGNLHNARTYVRGFVSFHTVGFTGVQWVNTLMLYTHPMDMDGNATLIESAKQSIYTAFRKAYDERAQSDSPDPEGDIVKIPPVDLKK